MPTLLSARERLSERLWQRRAESRGMRPQPGRGTRGVPRLVRLSAPAPPHLARDPRSLSKQLTKRGAQNGLDRNSPALRARAFTFLDLSRILSQPTGAVSLPSPPLFFSTGLSLPLFMYLIQGRSVFFSSLPSLAGFIFFPLDHFSANFSQFCSLPVPPSAPRLWDCVPLRYSHFSFFLPCLPCSSSPVSFFHVLVCLSGSSLHAFFSPLPLRDLALSPVD